MQRMQQCNLRNLPENYTFRYYLYHSLNWNTLLFVAEDDNKIVGYVMAKLDDDNDDKKKKTNEAHITSLSVLRTHRKMGIATKLMRATHHQMKTVYDCDGVTLHVRVSNRAALTLYKDVLGYDIKDTEVGYYADKEDAYKMRLDFRKNKEETKAEELTPQGTQASDTYAEGNPEKESQAPGSKASKNKRKRDKAKQKKQEEEKE